jgi:hypothetical protein
LLKEPHPELVNEYRPTSKKGVAFEGIRQYPHYIDLLRNEGPLSALFVTDDTSPEFKFTQQKRKE